jgi:hypothetical protein
MDEHDPKSSPAQIIRYNKKNPDEKQVMVDSVKGEAAAIRMLHKFRSEEKEPDKYVYYWAWANKAAAREYEEERDGVSPKPSLRKKAVKGKGVRPGARYSR